MELECRAGYDRLFGELRLASGVLYSVLIYCHYCCFPGCWELGYRMQLSHIGRDCLVGHISLTESSRWSKILEEILWLSGCGCGYGYG